jgi:hypothetical protein
MGQEAQTKTPRVSNTPKVIGNTEYNISKQINCRHGLQENR